MKDIAKHNLIFYSIIPTIFYILALLVISIFSKALPCFIVSAIIMAFILRRLRRNIRSLGEIQDKLDTTEEILYLSNNTILSKDSIINIKFDFFIINYCDIDNIWLDNVTMNLGYKPYIIVLETKNNKEYRIRFIDYLTSFYDFRYLYNSYRYETKKIIETIKLCNPDIKLYGKAEYLYKKQIK